MQADLFGDLAEHFLCQVAFPHCFIETHELDNVTSANSASVIPQKLAVTVKLLHQLELLAFTHAHDDNAGRLARRLDDQRLDPAHVMNRTIGQDQQDVVDVLPVGCRCVLGESLDDWTEHRWSSQANPWQLLLIGLENTHCAQDARLLWVAIQGKAVRYLIHAEGNGTKAERRE